MKLIFKRTILIAALSLLVTNVQAGKWLTRDPIQEGAGFVDRDPIEGNEWNLYAFVKNDPVNSIDPFGLWKIARDSSQNWAYAKKEGDQDTPQSLATLLHLNYSEFNVWAKPTNCGFMVPNVVEVYTSQKSKLEKIGILPFFVNECRSLAIQSGQAYEGHKYKVNYHLGVNDEQTFIKLWNTDGIFAIAFGGHGAEDQLGFVAQSGSAVDPKQVSPPYHLQGIGAYSCSSALNIIHVTPIGPNTTGKWREWISEQGTFVGFTAEVNWFNVWWNQEYVNPGVIPP